MKIIDANILLRYLLRDDEKLFEKAVNIIENENVVITDITIAEVVYVLEKVYKINRKEIAVVLKKIFDFNIVACNDKGLIISALELYHKHNLDFADSVLLAYKRIKKQEILTFDKKLKKLAK